MTGLKGDARNKAEHCGRAGARDALPAPVSILLKSLAGAVEASQCDPPRAKVWTAYGVVTLEAKWLIPAGALPEDAAKDPKSCLISVAIELREHALARAARVLRESGATPAQLKVGIQLALGKSKPAIADALGVEPSSVVSLAKKLYQTLDIHNSTELATKIWLGGNHRDAYASKLPGPPALGRIFAPNYKRITHP